MRTLTCKYKTWGENWLYLRPYLKARILRQSLSVRCAVLTSPQKRRNSCLRLRSRSVFGSFVVVLMSCKVNFHVVRSALQNSVCPLTVSSHYTGQVFVIPRKPICYNVNSNGPGRHKSFTQSNIVPAWLEERVWCTKFLFLLLKIYFRLSGFHYSLIVIISAVVRIGVYIAPKYDTKPIRYVTLHLRAITVLMWEQTPYLAWFSWRRKSYVL